MVDFKNVVCFDLETALIRTGLQAPPVSVCAVYRPSEGVKLYGTFELEEQMAALLLNQDVILLGHNVAYDFVCLWEWYPRLRPHIKAAYEANRVFDTGLIWRIVEISKGDMRGGLSLERLCQLVGIRMNYKHATDEDGEEIKLGFGKHWGTNLSGLTPEERAYCSDDVELCWRLGERVWNQGWANQKDLGKLCRTDFALKTISAFGLRADPDIVTKLEAEAQRMIAQMTELAIEGGFMRREKNKPNPVRTMRAYQQSIADAFHIKTRAGEGRNRNRLYPDDSEDVQRLAAHGLITDTGAISTAKMVLQESGDESLIMLADLGEWLAVVNKDLKIFKEGVFHSRFGFANTLRTTSSKPNIQNFRRKAGVRECIMPAWGCFVASDYSGLENGTLAQCIVNYTGRHGMAEKISRGHDFHAEIGAMILDIGYEEMLLRLDANHPGYKEAKSARGAAKPANFGLPGYMTNPVTFMNYARVGYGVRLTLEQATRIMNFWWATQHDQMAYLKHVDTFKDTDTWGSFYSVPIPGTSIIRRGATRTAAANTGFQALGMQTAADALWYTVMAQLLGDMPGRLCGFIHDELLTDCQPLDRDQVRWHQEKWMLKAAEENLPDVKMSIESQAFTRWTKDFPKGWQHHNKDGTLNMYEVTK